MFDADPSYDLKQLLVDAVKKNQQIGSSTCVLAKFDNERGNVIRTTNLGDSGYMLLRPTPAKAEKFEQLFRSKEQQYSFNFPYQCGTGAELPTIAYDTLHEVQDNDIIVMASDGMFDNLYDTDVHDCIKPYLVKDALEDLQRASECLADKAEKLGDDEHYFSPFAKGAKEHGKRFMGGKADDIVVIVAQLH